MVEYLTLFDTAEIQTDKRSELKLICESILDHEEDYFSVANITTIPWSLIAAIHFRESSLSFKKHLHNGDPLTARTTHVPRDRPLRGDPPFDWDESAIDALTGFWKPKHWDLPGSLEFLERYNGLGYRKCGVNSPYLWDWTQHYTSGLFVRDGKFDPKVRENRAGCVAIFKLLYEWGVELGIQPTEMLH